jgi:putative nucleotidyltransferase with HDIG domain
VSQGVPYLHSLAHALTTMQLYAVGHPARSRVGEMTYARLRALLDEDPCPHFTFMDGAVILGNNPLPDLQHWPWAKKLNQMGVQRLEFDPTVSLVSYGLFLEDLLARITTDREHNVPLPARDGIKSGLVRVTGEYEAPAPEAASAGATLPYSLGEEADIVRWIYERAEMLHDVPLDEVEGVVRSLAVAMHADGELLLPLLQLRSADEYAARHAINVAIIAMTFAETLDMAPRDVRAFGIAGLLHDIGMTRIPKEVLAKDTLTNSDRELVRQHPVDGAKLLLRKSDEHEIAAVAAYEHHARPDGSGYPVLRFPRNFHYVSKVIAVCDAYDALRSPKSYRAAWTHEQALTHIEGEAGRSFDHAVGNSFVAMMRRLEGRVMHGDHPGELPPLLPEVSSFDYRPGSAPRLLSDGSPKATASS